jgi:hypothetical protein
MRTVIIEVPRSGATVELVLRAGAPSGQAVVVLSDGVEFRQESEPATLKPRFQTYRSETGFPPRSLTEEAIIQILREHGGSVKIRNKDTGWNIYDEIAARLGVSVEARQKLTAVTQEPAWRPEVGFARKNLEQRGVILPTEESGWGVWKLAENELHC